MLALSLGTADGGYEEPYISREALPYPSVELRQALIASQQLRYIHRLQYGLGIEDAAKYMRLFVPMSSHFDADYVNGVYSIFADSYLGGNKALIEEYYGGGT